MPSSVAASGGDAFFDDASGGFAGGTFTGVAFPSDAFAGNADDGGVFICAVFSGGACLLRKSLSASTSCMTGILMLKPKINIGTAPVPFDSLSMLMDERQMPPASMAPS